MATNKDWPRWIFASIMKHLKDVATADGHPSYIEGADHRGDTMMKSPLWVEFRSTGPFARQISGNEYSLNVFANVLITSNEKSSPYEIIRVAGLYQEALSTTIPIYNYGNLAGDYVEGVPESQIHLGCFTPEDGRSDKIGVYHFGYVEKSSKVRQSLVDASLQTYLS